jgi:hypothetical protein
LSEPAATEEPTSPLWTAFKRAVAVGVVALVLVAPIFIWMLARSGLPLSAWLVCGSLFALWVFVAAVSVSFPVLLAAPGLAPAGPVSRRGLAVSFLAGLATAVTGTLAMVECAYAYGAWSSLIRGNGLRGALDTFGGVLLAIVRSPSLLGAAALAFAGAAVTSGWLVRSRRAGRGRFKQFERSVWLVVAVSVGTLSIVKFALPDAPWGDPVVLYCVALAWLTGFMLSILLPLGEVVELAARKVRSALRRGGSG